MKDKFVAWMCNEVEISLCKGRGGWKSGAMEDKRHIFQILFNNDFYKIWKDIGIPVTLVKIHF